jgi:LacI family transcriptional regulator
MEGTDTTHPPGRDALPATPYAGPAGPERRATMRDVAQRAGVSVMTVSRVVNENVHVEEQTRQRVLSAIGELGYLQHAAASDLRRTHAHTSTLGLVVDDVANPFCSAVQRGVERECRARGYLLVAGSSDRDASQEHALVTAFLRRRFTGLLIMGSDADHGYLAAEVRRGVPVVFVDRSPAGFEADVITSDNVGGALAGVRHLLARGHRRIALLAGELGIETTVLRRQGYRRALEEAAVAVEEGLERCDLLGPAAAQEALGALLDGPDPPTAVFAAQNLVTVGALRALHARGLQHRVALVGFDDVELGDLLDPPVSVVAQDPELVGTLAARRLFERLGGLTAPASSLVVATALLARGSGELPPP